MPTKRAAATVLVSWAVLAVLVVGAGWLLTHPWQRGVAGFDDPISRWFARQRTPALTEGSDPATFLGETPVGVALVVVVAVAFALWRRSWRPLVFAAVVEAGLRTLPARSPYALAIGDVLDWHRQHPNDWRATWKLIEGKWNAREPCPEGALRPFNIDAKLNGAYIALGLLYGDGDFTKTLDVATRAGQDSDCNPSNALGVLGVMHGYERIPDVWKAGIPAIADTRFNYTAFTFRSIVASTERRAIAQAKRHGGRVDATTLYVRTQAPTPWRLELWDDYGSPRERVPVSDARWTFTGAWQAEASSNVRPGTYREGLVLEDSVTLIADGPADSVVIESPDSDGILIQTNAAVTMRGFTIRSIAGRNDGKYYGIDCQQGTPVFEDCDITSDSLACVAIHGAGTNPTFRRCRVRDGTSGGFFCYENGRGVAEDCNISGNTLANVEVKTGGAMTVRRSRIHDGEAGNVFVNEHATGLFEDCDVYRSALSNVEVKDGSAPTFRRCKMREAKQVGVFVNAGGLGLFEDCEMLANTLAGIEIKGGANPTIRHCRVYDGKAGGIFINTLGRGVVEDCDVTNNAFAGVEITDNGDPVVRRTRVHDGQQGGVFVYAGGKGTLEDCDVVNNTRAGFEIKDRGNPVARRCRVNGNGYQAVWVYEGGAGSFEYCDLTGNAKGAWLLENNANPRRVGNKE